MNACVSYYVDRMLKILITHITAKMPITGARTANANFQFR